jgi:hypothetical protein
MLSETPMASPEASPMPRAGCRISSLQQPARFSRASRSSTLGAALGTAAPYAAGAIVGFFVLQVAVEKLREAVQPLVAPAIVFGALGTALYVSAQLNAIRLPDPSVVFFPVGAASAAFVAYSLLSAPTNAPQQESEEEDATAGVVPMEPMGAVVVDTAKEGNADESDDTATEV